jgi:hypothetical protein
MHVDIGKLQKRAARHPSNHVKRFVPLIDTVISAIKATGLTVEQRYENQILIDGRWIGRFEHANTARNLPSRMVIYDGLDARPGSPRYPDPNDPAPIIEIRNTEQANLFASTVRWLSRI